MNIVAAVRSDLLAHLVRDIQFEALVTGPLDSYQNQGSDSSEN